MAFVRPYAATHTFYFVAALWGYAELDARGDHVGGLGTDNPPLEHVPPREQIYDHWRWPLIPGMNEVVERALKVKKGTNF